MKELFCQKKIRYPRGTLSSHGERELPLRERLPMANNCSRAPTRLMAHVQTSFRPDRDETSKFIMKARSCERS
jgi:hypothetical protein